MLLALAYELSDELHMEKAVNDAPKGMVRGPRKRILQCAADPRGARQATGGLRSSEHVARTEEARVAPRPR